MITDLILSIPAWLLNSALSVIPNSAGLPDSMGTMLTALVGYIKAVSWLFPIETLFQITLLTLALEGGILLWHFVNWLLKKIPGVQ